MTKTLIYLLILSGLIPATLLLGLNLLGLAIILNNGAFAFKEIIIITTCLCGICGYVGLCMLLLGKQLHHPFRVCTLLALGVSAFVVFISVEGRRPAWEWVLTIAEPDEWIILVWPSVVALIFLIKIAIELLKAKLLRKQNDFH
ncbi:MAG TPA: hypothetical protein VD794_10635 [Flavisolibacter sp.]|nr:hypothetical protein [Flavisolibacter sp.]